MTQHCNRTRRTGIHRSTLFRNATGGTAACALALHLRYPGYCIAAVVATAFEPNAETTFQRPVHAYARPAPHVACTMPDGNEDLAQLLNGVPRIPGR